MKKYQVTLPAEISLIIEKENKVSGKTFSEIIRDFVVSGIRSGSSMSGLEYELKTISQKLEVISQKNNDKIDDHFSVVFELLKAILYQEIEQGNIVVVIYKYLIASRLMPKYEKILKENGKISDEDLRLFEQLKSILISYNNPEKSLTEIQEISHQDFSKSFEDV